MGDFYVSVDTVQNEEKEEEENVSPFGFNRFSGGFEGYNNRSNPRYKLTKPIQIPQHNDRMKQVYHYRISQLLAKHERTKEHVLYVYSIWHWHY